MTPERFEQVFEQAVARSRKVLIEKSGQYSRENDKLHNFRVAARVGGTTLRKALWGMFAKHLVSLMDWVVYNDHPTTAQRDEKFVDAINYMILLEAIMIEEAPDEVPECGMPSDMQARADMDANVLDKLIPPRHLKGRYLRLVVDPKGTAKIQTSDDADFRTLVCEELLKDAISVKVTVPTPKQKKLTKKKK